MKKPDPTIYDVAREAGVSIATVSRVLNFPHRVNPTTRTTVINAIERLGYVPKAESRARALMGTRRIGVLIPFFTEPSFVQRLRGISTVLTKKDYEMVIYPVDSKERSLSFLETIPIRKTLDGLIILSQVFDQTITDRLIENHLETVTVEFNNHKFTSLEINDKWGGQKATNFLLEKGYKKIAFVGGRKKPVFGIDPISKRLEGYKKAISDAGQDIQNHLIYDYVYDHSKVLKELVKSGLPMAIFAASDVQAIALMKEIRLMGLRIPEDIAVIGFDNIDMAEYFGLTTIHQPLDESGRISASLLISRISNPSQSTQHIELPLRIIPRESV